MGEVHGQLPLGRGRQLDRQGKFDFFVQLAVGPLVQVGRRPVVEALLGRPGRQVARLGVHQGVALTAVFAGARDVLGVGVGGLPARAAAVFDVEMVDGHRNDPIRPAAPHGTGGAGVHPAAQHII